MFKILISLVLFSSFAAHAMPVKECYKKYEDKISYLESRLVERETGGYVTADGASGGLGSPIIDIHRATKQREIVQYNRAFELLKDLRKQKSALITMTDYLNSVRKVSVTKEEVADKVISLIREDEICKIKKNEILKHKFIKKNLKKHFKKMAKKKK